MVRATHDLTDRHHGMRAATTVALDSLIGDLPAGTTLEQAVREIHQRLTMIEDGGGRRYGSITANAVRFKTIPKSFTANSRIRVKQNGSFTADAELNRGGRISASAVIKANRERTFTANARIEIRVTFKADATKRKRVFKALFADASIYRGETWTITGSAKGDAVIKKLTSGSLAADALLTLTFAPVTDQFWADAVIESSMGSFVLANAITMSALGESISSDAIARKAYASSFDALAITLVNMGQSALADAVIKRSSVSSMLADAIMLAALAQSLTADAVLLSINSASFTSDAMLSSMAQASISADAYLVTQSERLDAHWDNFWHRGQSWYGFDMDG